MWMPERASEVRPASPWWVPEVLAWLHNHQGMAVLLGSQKEKSVYMGVSKVLKFLYQVFKNVFHWACLHI